MIRRLDIGFARLTIDTATNTGSVNWGRRTDQLSAFEYVVKLGLGDRRTPRVRFEVVQEVPGMSRSPFKATIEAELISDIGIPGL